MADPSNPPAETAAPEAKGATPKTPVDATSTQHTPIDSLPQDVQDMVRSLRSESATRRLENSTLQSELQQFREAQMSDLEKATTQATTEKERADAAEAKLIRYQVAAAKGISSDAIDFLSGKTQEELEQSADKLKALMGERGPMPPPDFGAGARPPGGNGSLTPSESFSATLRRAAGRQ